MKLDSKYVLRTILMTFSLAGVLALAGCGGGGGTAAGTPTPTSTIISGTAAAGAPIVGTVSIRDSSSNPQPVKTGIPIAADGKYSVDVKGLTAPFAFLADGTVGGKRVQLYSAATQADVGGTIDITPFTDLVVRNIAGTIATTLADAIAAKLPGLTAADLDAKRVDLTNKLGPVLLAAGLSSSIDLLRASFNADGTGLDRFMDLVKVDATVPTAVTITNILDAANPLTVDTATGTTSGTLSATGITATATTPVDGIAQTFNTFGTFFATSLPSPTNTNLTALFSGTFIDGGQSSGAFLTDITTNNSIIGLKFANGVVVDSVDTVAGTAWVHFVPVSAAGADLAHDQPGGAINWRMKLVAGKWLFDGDQRIANVRVRTFAQQNVCNSGNNGGCTVASATYLTGLNLNIDNKAQAAIGSAVVTGPGLPPAGLKLTAVPNQTWFSLPVSTNCGGCTNNNYAMTDANIQNIPANSTYTVALYSNTTSPTLLATYTDVVPVAPVLNTALSTLSFPSISGMVSLMGYTSGTLTPAWTIPAGQWGDDIGVSVYQQGTTAGTAGPNQWVSADLKSQTATSGTSTLVIGAPPTGSWTGGNYSIYTWDQYGGQLDTNYQ